MTIVPMGYREARELGIDPAEFETVRKLPAGVMVRPVAAIWGDYLNLRCLFVAEDGQKLMRNVYSRGGYAVPEIGVTGRELVEGQWYVG